MPEAGNASHAATEAIVTEVRRQAMMAWATAAPPFGKTGSAAVNAAIARCGQAYCEALDVAAMRGKSVDAGILDAEQAFRRALPSLARAGNIRPFIACVTYGMAVGAMRSADGARMIHAAQAALLAGENWPRRIRRR